MSSTLVQFQGESYIVERTQIIGTGHVTFAVWTALEGHTTQKAGRTGRLGRVGTEPLPHAIAALAPNSPERRAAARAWREGMYALAYQIIEKVYPEAAALTNRNIGTVSHFSAPASAAPVA